MIDLKKYIDLYNDYVRVDNLLNLEELLNDSSIKNKYILVTGGRQVGLTTTAINLIKELLLINSNFKIGFMCNKKSSAFEQLKHHGVPKEKLFIFNDNADALCGYNLDFLITDHWGTGYNTLALNYMRGACKNIIMFTTPNKNYGFEYEAYKSKEFKKIVFNNPLPQGTIINLLDSGRYQSLNGKAREELYYNMILGRYYDEKEILTINNINISKILYTLMIERMVEFEKTHKRKITMAEYIVELIKQDIINNIAP